MTTPMPGAGALPAYRLPFLDPAPALTCAFEDPAWREVPVARIACFRPESSAHRPRVSARLVWSADGLHGIFDVRDRDTRGVCRAFMDPVYEDSCVEFFVQPEGVGPYFNFEFSGAGGWLASLVRDPSRIGLGGLKDCVPLDPARAGLIGIHSTMPAGDTPGPVDWTLSFHLPWSVMDRGSGEPRPRAGAVWRGNFYKCGDRTPGPHWAAWAPVAELNFHLPACFGELHFS
ncbi:MAG: carbohydrate-binding family 9-like protein [Kiritimatiellae bacterium]|nr:carbohydrate-binding family 9-like protein [Kiritimatiellia bacterium]